MTRVNLFAKRVGRVALAAALMLGAGCAPARDAETLFKQLRSADLEARQEATEQLDDLVRQGDYRVFLRGVDSADRIYRAQSIIFLARIDRPEARRALHDLLRIEKRSMLPFNPIRFKPTTEEFDSRILVANLIAQSGGDPEAVGTLTAGADDQSPDVLAATCFALGALHDPKAIPFLAAQARNPQRDVARAAVQALSRFKEPEVIVALRPVIQHPSAEVRGDVLGALDLHEGPEVVEILKTIGASDPSPEIRAAAIGRLTRFRDRSLVPYLIDRLRGRDGAPRAAALAALGSLTGQALGPHPEQWTRWWAQNEKTFAPSR